MTDRHHVVLDIETTGLIVGKHEILEVAWSLDFDVVREARLPHSLLTADPEALRITRYRERDMPRSGDPEWWLTLADLHRDLWKATVIGANPEFDRGHLAHLWGGDRPWHYRSLDVESMAAQFYGWDHPKGLMDVVMFCRAEGFEIPEPDHTAAGDVRTTIAVYRALREQQSAVVALAATARLKGLNAPTYTRPSLDNS